MRGIRTITCLLALVAVLAACSQGTDTKTSSSSADKQEAGRRYAQCMRDNGVPDFPDPDANGDFKGNAHEQQDDPKFKAALEKCRELAPGGEHQNPGDPAYVEQLRAFSKCMRDNGVPNYPDPDPDGQLRGQGHEQQDSPKFKAAMEKCRAKLPGGGDHE
jgi:hypothetical protein